MIAMQKTEFRTETAMCGCEIRDPMENLICHVRYEAFRSLEAVYVADRLGNLSCGHVFGIHGDNLIVNV